MSKVKLFYPFIIIFCLIFAFNKTDIALSIIIAVTVHELGHVIAIRILNGKIIANNLFGIGADIEYVRNVMSVKTDIIVYLAGPVSGMLGAFIGETFGFHSFALYSTALSVINLIPAYPLDGGNILKSVLPPDKSDNISLIVSFVIACILSLTGLIIILLSGNFSVFSLGISILISIIPKRTLQ